ncbi:MAG: hypothetical protein HOO67_07140 [Candidatus Peribacteraceae bacterium]|nr:hypothetical protein [Candidatus Peribacteraceae bacterium]
MKRLLPALALTFLLVACSKTVTLNVAFDSQDPVRLDQLKASLERVVVGRMESKGKKVTKQALVTKDDATTLTVTVSDADGAQVLSDGLTTPFTMSIMKQVEAGLGDIISEKFGEFKETGIETKHFDWVAPTLLVTEAGASQGSVVLKFTPEGQTLLKEMFAKNRGSVIGVFVRGQLMSKKLIDAKDKQDAIQIDGIPSADLANAFADDVNVGLHVTFTAAQ